MCEEDREEGSLRDGNQEFCFSRVNFEIHSSSIY